MALNIGDKAPAFKLPSTEGKNISLADYKGRKIVLYFYPRDATPGCTAEACSFRDTMESFDSADAVILGISPDDEKTHEKFRTRFGLPFPLLSDVDHKVAEDYDVWKEKSMYGKKYMGVERSTFLIDGAGKIARIFRKVKVDGHAREVLDALAAM